MESNISSPQAQDQRGLVDGQSESDVVACLSVLCYHCADFKTKREASAKLFLIVRFPSRSTFGILSIVVVIMIAYVLCGALPLRAQDDCKLLEKLTADALHKVHNTPTHVYTTSKINGQSFGSEIIYAAGSMYVKSNGKWISGGSIKDMEQTEQQLQHNANSKDTCRQLKDESINGEVAAVYNSHSETPKGTIDLQVWISKANSNLLRQDMTSNGVLMSSRYEYSDVKPPL
jgi:hypothetical protein